MLNNLPYYAKLDLIGQEDQSTKYFYPHLIKTRPILQRTAARICRTGSQWKHLIKKSN